MILNPVERYLKEQGIKEGIENVISNILINSTLTDEEIAYNTNIPLDKVLEIKNKIQIDLETN